MIWELASGRVIRVLRGHEEGGIYDPSFSRDGKTLATTGSDETVRIWDVEKGKEIAQYSLSGEMVRPVVLSPDGSVLAAGFRDGTIRLRDVATGRVIRRLQGQSLTHFIAFSPDGRMMTSLGTDGNLAVWDLTMGKEVRHVPLEAWNAIPGLLLVSGNLKTIVAPRSGGGLGVWQPATGRQSRKIQLDEPGSLVNLWAISPDGATIALASWYDSTLQLWDVVTGKEKCPYPRHLGGVRSIAFTPDDKMIVSAGEDCTLRLWDVATGKEVRRILDGPPQIWKLPAGTDERGDLLSKVGPTGEIGLSPDGKTAISTGVDGTVRLWDLATGKDVRRIKLEQVGPIRTIRFAPDGKLVAPVCGDDNTVGLWDMTTGKAIRRISTRDMGTSDIAFAPDGKTIASTGDDGNVNLWETSTLRLLSRSKLSQDLLWCVAFSPNGKTICAGGADDIILFQSLKNGEVQRSRRRPSSDIRTLSVAFSADSNLACSSGDDGVVRVWDVNKAKEVAQFRGDQGLVMQVAFSHNSRFIASAGWDGTILVWDLSQVPPKANAAKRD